MYITELEAEFETANPTTAAVKLGMETNNGRSDLSCHYIDGDKVMSAHECWTPR
jgi:hypothetical protein